MREIAISVVLLTASTSLALAQSVRYVYDDLGRLTGVIDQNGNVAQYVYDANGNTTSINRYTSSQVSVLNFSPTSGSPGSTVTISGSGFSSSPTQDVVSFNGVSASVSSASANTLVVQVPANATSGLISVVAPAGTASSLRSFIINPAGVGAPSISTFSPTVTTSGAVLDIHGANFRSTLRENVLLLNGYVLPISSIISQGELQASLPSSVGSGHLQLSTPRGVTTSSADLFVPPGAYTAGQTSVAQRLTLRSASTFPIPASGNMDLLLFDGAKGQQASFSVSGLNSSSNLSLTVYGTNLSAVGSGLFPGATIVSGIALPATGTYAAVVTGGNGSSGSYSLTPYVYKDLTGSLTLGTAYPFTLSTPGQKAMLSFPGVANQAASIQVSSASFPQCSTVNVLDSTAATIGSGPVCGSSGTVNVNNLSTSGNYTVQVIPNQGSTGSATVTATTIANVTGTLSSGQSITVTFQSTAQTARISFNATSGQHATLQVTGATINHANLSIVNSAGSSISTGMLIGSSASMSNVSIPSTGTYTFVIAPASGSQAGQATVALTLN